MLRRDNPTKYQTYVCSDCWKITRFCYDCGKIFFKSDYDLTDNSRISTCSYCFDHAYEDF